MADSGAFHDLLKSPLPPSIRYQGDLDQARGGNMPRYEYQCQECREEFTRTEHMSEHGSKAPTCPKCESKKVVPVFSSFYAKTAHKS